MLSKIKRLIKKYNKRIDTISKELKKFSEIGDYEAYITLLKEQGVYVNVVIDLENMIK